MYSRVKSYGARSLMWPREQHRRKIPTGASLRARNRTGDTNRTGLVVGCDWGIRLIISSAWLRSVAISYIGSSISSVWHSNSTHDDVIKWKYFPRYWPFVRGIDWSPVNSPHKGQWRGALLFSFICAYISGWVNNREAGDLRRHRANCDVNVMPISYGWLINSSVWHNHCLYLTQTTSHLIRMT